MMTSLGVPYTWRDGPGNLPYAPMFFEQESTWLGLRMSADLFEVLGEAWPWLALTF